MARKEDQPLIDQIDSAIDQMNIEIPNWRSDLYKEYYGAQALNTELSASEQALLEKLRSENAVIRAALAPDGALMVTYTAQKLAREDIQNRLRTDIVQGATVELRMAVNADLDCDFYGIWEKTLSVAAPEVQDNIIQEYVETYPTATWVQYLADHPEMWVLLAAVLTSIFFGVLHRQSVKSRNEQEAISDELTVALSEAKAATEAKNEFFSRMSHDIRTPLNAVLGMSQISRKYRDTGMTGFISKPINPDAIASALLKI